MPKEKCIELLIQAYDLYSQLSEQDKRKVDEFLTRKSKGDKNETL